MADNVKLVLEFDATGAIQNVQNFGSKLKKETSEASSAFDGLHSKLLAVGASIAAYFTVGAIKDFFGAIISESMDAEQNLNQMNGALQRAGTYSEKSSQAMQDFATSMMSVTTIDDDVIIGQLAIARNFAKTDEQARKLVAAAGDLSAAMGIDLGTATELLGRTLDGTAGRFNETVPALRNVSAEALKAGAAIDVVAAAFEGAAANKVKTFEGALQQLGNSFGNLKDAMGDAITQNPMIIAGINELSRLFAHLTGQVSDSKDGMNSWINEGMLGLINAIRSSIPYLNDFISWLKSIAAILVILKDGFMGALDSIVLLGSGIGVLIEKFTGGQKSAYLFQTTLDDMAKRADRMKEALAGIGKDAFSQKEIEAFIKGLDRISAAASGMPAVKIKADLDTSGLKNDLGTVVVGGDKKEEPKPEDIKVPIGDQMVGKIGDDIETLLAPIKWFMQEMTLVLTKSWDIIKAISPGMAAAMGSIGSVFGGMGEDIGKAFVIIGEDLTSGSDDIFRAWDTAIGDYEGILQASFDSIRVAFNSIDWRSVGFYTGEALNKVGQAITLFTANLLSGSIAGGVAVAGTAVSSTVGNIGKGEAGAKTAIVDTLSMIGTAFDKALGTAGVIGDALKSFLTTLSNPQNLKALINGFIDAIPTIIDAMIDSMPTLMQGIVRALPVLMDGIIKIIPVLFEEIAKGIGPILITLADKMPDIIIAIAENLGPIVEALADAMPTIMSKLIAAIPRVATALIKSSIQVMWTLVTRMLPAMVEGILTGISKMLSNIGSGMKLGGTNSLMDSTWQDALNNLKKFLWDIPNKLTEAIYKLVKYFSYDIPIMIWEQGFKPLVGWISKLGTAIWEQGFLPLVSFIQQIGTFILERGIIPLTNFFAGIASYIWEQGLKPLTEFFANILTQIWQYGFLPLINWFANIATSIWTYGILPLINWFANLAYYIWNDGILPLVNWFASVPKLLWDALQDGIKSIGNVGGGEGGLLGGKVIPGVLATGGIVPKGYPNDTYPALLTSGETVIPAENASNLFKAIDALSKGNTAPSSDETNKLLRQLIALIAGQETTVNVQLDRSVLAKAILTLNKDNRRIA